MLVTGTNELASVTAPSQPSSVIGPPEPPASTGAPAISGTTTAGRTLSASTGGWAGSQPLRYTYQWQSCSPAGGECSNIEGASEPRYTLATGDAGTTVRVVVTATNSAGSASASSSATAVIAAAQPPANDSAPTITGHPNDGQNLIARQGVWSGSLPIEYGYQWESCNEHGQECAPVEGASEPEYELGDGDIGTTVRVKVTARNAGGTSEAYSPATAPIEGEAPSEQEPPSISGTPDADGVLSASPGVWTGSRQQLSYQWESCNEHGQECAPIEGASEPEYQLGSGDVGSTVRVRVGLHSLTASLTDVSQPTVVIGAAGTLVSTALPQIGSDPQVGSRVQADTGAWSSSGSLIYTFQWQRCELFGGGCSDIEGATSETYTPVAGDLGDTLRVRVSASDAHEAAAASSPASQPVAVAGAPTVEQASAIEGTTLEGQTLTASRGSWSSESPTSYTYQWERCDPATVCAMIEGATEASYTLTTGDVGASIVAVINASNRHGSATAVSRASAIIQPTSLIQISQPTLAGAVEVGGTLTATPGIWSGEGTISYAYQWESCGPGESSCTPIEGATEETYTLPPAEQGSALRAKITITGPHASHVLYTPATVGVPGGEVTPTEAQEVAQQTDPALLAPATTAELEEKTIAPTLADGEEQLTAHATLTSATVSKENPAELAVNTPVGELSLTPTETLPTASTVPTIVNETAALFANTWPATDTIVRPEPLGANALLQVRSAEAPKTFTWSLRLGPNQTLQQLPNGSIAVINTPEHTEPIPTEPTGAPPSAEGPPETPTQKTEIEHEETEAEEVKAKGEEETPVPLEALPPAPTASTLSAEPPAGMLQPNNTQAEATTAQEAIAYSEERNDGQTLMVIRAPAAVDSQGEPVSATLTTTGTSVTMHLAPNTDATYPITAQLALASFPNHTSEERDPVSYGLADDTVQAFSPFDKNLAAGAMHVKKARLVIPYDVLFKHVRERETTAQHERERLNKEPEETKYELLTHWVAAVQKEHISEILITVGRDESCPHGNKECELPGLEEYRAGFKDIMQWANARGIKTFGAWNEPDLPSDPTWGHSKLAAQYWQVAQYVITHNRCGDCTVVAGEFAAEPIYNQNHLDKYRNTLHEHHHICDRCWSGTPSVWGFHDYHDVVHVGAGRGGGTTPTPEYLTQFNQFTGGNTGKGQIWITETDVELQDGKFPTELSEEATHSKSESEELQRRAAEAILELHDYSSRLDRIYYYQYREPSEARRESTGKPHLFDGGLVEALPEKRSYGDKGERRPAYCILAKCSTAT